MINYNKEVVSALNKVLPTHYEMALTKKTETPCISYMELSNTDNTVGETMGYSDIAFQVKVWSNSVGVIQENCQKVDKAMRNLGFSRIGSAELQDKNSTMIQKILTYKCLGIENY